MRPRDQPNSTLRRTDLPTGSYSVLWQVWLHLLFLFFLFRGLICDVPSRLFRIAVAIDVLQWRHTIRHVGGPERGKDLQANLLNKKNQPDLQLGHVSSVASDCKEWTKPSHSHRFKLHILQRQLRTLLTWHSETHAIKTTYCKHPVTPQAVQ